jgi:hypothetical protein
MERQNRRITAAFIIAIGAAQPVHAQQTITDLALNSGDWTTTDQNGIFADTWSSGTQQVAFALNESTRRFEIQLTGSATSLPNGSKASLQLSFSGNAGNPIVQLQGESIQNVLTASIPDNEVASLTHDLTAYQQMRIKFNRTEDWSISLNGTTPTISIMANAISFAGIQGLPAPYNDPMKNFLGNPPPPVEDAADFVQSSYNFTILDQTSTRPDPDTPGMTLELEQQLPQISSPLTPQAIVFNQSIKKFISSVLPGSVRVIDTNVAIVTTSTFDNEDFTIDFSDFNLPGIVSIGYFDNEWCNECSGGSSLPFSFNWVLAKERFLKPSDIFVPGKNWQQALIGLVNAQRQWGGLSPETDISQQITDPSRWLLSKDGIAIGFTDSDFFGYRAGGRTTSVTIPWSDLRGYLKKTARHYGN